MEQEVSLSGKTEMALMSLESLTRLSAKQNKNQLLIFDLTSGKISGFLAQWTDSSGNLVGHTV